MKLRFIPDSHCPFGRFVVEAENESDRALLQCFMTPATHALKEWQFGIGAWSYNLDHRDTGLYAFNFGWAQRKSENGEASHGPA